MCELLLEHIYAYLCTRRLFYYPKHKSSPYNKIPALNAYRYEGSWAKQLMNNYDAIYDYNMVLCDIHHALMLLQIAGQ